MFKEQLQSNTTIINLKPMQIRTFRITII